MEATETGPKIIDTGNSTIEESKEDSEIKLVRALSQVENYNKEHSLRGRILDGFRDAGLRFDFDKTGNTIDRKTQELVTPDREIIVVDRQNDRRLQALITKAKEMMDPTDPSKTAFEIAKLVYQTMNDPDAVKIVEDQFEGPDSAYKGKEIYLGDISVENDLAGVCRHRALLFQILTEEAGLDVTLRRGFLESGKDTTDQTRRSMFDKAGDRSTRSARVLLGLHVWNELEINGEKLIVDLMHPSSRRDFASLDYEGFITDGGFPKAETRNRFRYLNIKADGGIGEEIYQENKTVSAQSIPEKPNKTINGNPLYKSEEFTDSAGQSFIIFKDDNGQEVSRIVVSKNANGQFTKDIGGSEILFRNQKFDIGQTWNYDQSYRYTAEWIYVTQTDPKTGEVMQTYRIPFKEGAENWTLFEDTLTIPDLLDRVETIIRQKEEDQKINGEFFDDFRTDLLPYLTKYAYDPTIKRQLETLRFNVEARGIMVIQNVALGIPDYEGFTKEILFDLHFNQLINNIPHLAELIEEMEKNDGLYFREEHNPRDPIRPITGAMHSSVDAKISSWFGGATPTPKDVSDRATLLGIATRLFNVTLMAGFYSGPVDTSSGNLIDTQIMDEIDRGFGGRIPVGSESRFAENKNFYRARTVERKANLRDFKFGGRSISDPSSGGRRVLYWPEEAQDKNTGRASSLRYSLETYVLSLPHMSGYRSLSEFLGKPAQPQPKRYSSPRWQGMVKGASDMMNASRAFLNEPIIGGKHLGDLSKVGDHMKNETGVDEAYAKYLYRTPEIQGYAVGALDVYTTEYVNSNASDRLKEFSEWKKMGPEFRNHVLEVHSAFMDTETREHALRLLNATEKNLLFIETRKQGLGWSWETLKALFKYISRK